MEKPGNCPTPDIINSEENDCMVVTVIVNII